MVGKGCGTDGASRPSCRAVTTTSKSVFATDTSRGTVTVT